MIYKATYESDTDVNFIELTNKLVETKDDGSGDRIFKETSYNIRYIISVSE